MLRRKLIIILCSVLALLLITAVGAIVSLQGILSELYHLETRSWAVTEEANKLSEAVSSAELELMRDASDPDVHMLQVQAAIRTLMVQYETVEAAYAAHLPVDSPVMQRLGKAIETFASHARASPATQNAVAGSTTGRGASGGALELRQEILALSRDIRIHSAGEQAALTSRFRWLVFVLAAVFLVLINFTIVVLLRMAGMVLRPVEQLLEATRQLAGEHYDYRVEVHQHDEFDELACSYNRLADQLQSNERRKLEMMQQVALALNHELNNAIAAIELQLRLLGKEACNNLGAEKCARRIHESLGRMTRSVEQLKHVRRIVLTDYVSGVKMLDLERSALADGADGPAPLGAMASS